MKPASPESYKLLHDGAIALAQAEHNGIRIDEKYLDNAIAENGKTIASIRKSLLSSSVWKVWQKAYRGKANLNGRQQLADVLFKRMGEKYPWRGEGSKTAAGFARTDDATLERVSLLTEDDGVRQFIDGYRRLGDLEKVQGTYFASLKREIVDGLLHPFFHLHTVVTYRGSSSDPNFQNIPIRNPEIGKLIRTAFIPRRGRVLVEIDFSGVEVRCSACYNHDPVLIKYIEDPTTDMHRDTTCDLFLLDVKQVGKRTTRDWTKNRFVFPEFYGSVYFQCAPSLWKGVMSGAKLEGSDITVQEHLASKGITSLGACDPKQKAQPGTFEHHVKNVEDSFWKQRFAAYTAWKERWWRQYLRRGYLRMKTGFVCQGLAKRNDVLNYPIQGDAFHWLLWALIQSQNWLWRKKLKTKIVGQIHDCILADVPVNELQDFLSKVNEIITVRLPKHWPWICVPVAAETEVAETNWYEKRQWSCEGGKWGPAPK